MNKKSVLGLVLILGMAFSLAANEKYAEGKCYDTTDRLRIRSGSDLKSEVITVLDKGSCVVFLEEGPSATIDNITDSWVKVKALPRENWEDGKRCGTREGWLFGGYLKESPIVRDELFKGKDFSIVQYYDGKREIIDHRSHRYTRVFLVSDNQSEEYLTENEEPYSLYEGSIPKEMLLLNTEWLTPNDKVVYKDIDKDGQDEIIFCFDPYYRITYILKKEKKICKIIFALSLLDLDKSLAAVREPAKLEAVRYYLKNLYYQQLILKLKEKEPAAYRDLMGIFDVFDFAGTAPAAAQAADSDDLDITAFLEGAPAAPKSNVVDLGAGTVQDEFFKARLRLVNPLGMDIVMHSAGVDTGGHFFAESSEETFTLTDVRTPRLFAEALLDSVSNESSISLMTMMGKVDEIEKVLQQSSVKDAVSRVRSDARIAVLTAGDKENPNFAVLLNAWIKQKHAENELFLNEVRQFLNNVIR